MIESARHIIIRLATSETSGSGVYLKAFNLIVTGEHIVRGHAKVIIDNDEIQRQLADVVYTDSMMDLAFLMPQGELDLPEIDFYDNLILGQDVIAAASPFGQGYVASEGQVLDEHYEFHGIDHVSHDAILDNAGNGSPLFTEEGSLIGINNFILSKGKELGLTLPIHRIISEIQEYLSLRQRYVTRCPACSRQVVGDSNGNCSNCGEKIDLPNLDSLYTTSGIGQTIESILLSMGYTLDLARIGIDHWEVERGSAAVNITYYEKNGLIIAEAYMCKLPPLSNLALFEFLLRQNHKMENLTFSVKGDDIILSLLIYDRYLNEQTGTELLTNLLDKSDHFDNILVEQFNCLWTSSRKLT